MAICNTDVNAILNETKITNAVCKAPCDVQSSGNAETSTTLSWLWMHNQYVWLLISVLLLHTVGLIECHNSHIPPNGTENVNGL